MFIIVLIVFLAFSFNLVCSIASVRDEVPSPVVAEVVVVLVRLRIACSRERTGKKYWLYVVLIGRYWLIPV